MTQRMRRLNDDGGYHAIRGFAFQFDHYSSDITFCS